MSRPLFNQAQVLLLNVCGGIIVVCLAILGIDRFVVRRGEPPKDERIEALAVELGMTRHQGDGSAERLRSVLERFNTLAGSPDTVGPVLSRSREAGTLWLFEYTVRRRAEYKPGQADVRVNVPLFAVLIEFAADPGWPAWSAADGAEPPTPPFTLDSLQRLARMEQYGMAMEDRYVLFTSRQATGALQQAVNQGISADFHPGLLNSGMKIDVQRAIDVVNAMESGVPRLARSYQVEVPEIDIKLPSTTGISDRLQENRQVFEREREAMREERQRRDEALRAERSRRMEESRQRMRDTLAASREGARIKRDELKAEFEQTLAESAVRPVTPTDPSLGGPAADAR